jgi:tRNA modification GTPase
MPAPTRLSYSMPIGYLRLDVPIAAVATSAGASALAVVRTTGPGTLDFLASAFSRPDSLRSAEGYRAVHGWIRDPTRAARWTRSWPGVPGPGQLQRPGRRGYDLSWGRRRPGGRDGALERAGFSRALPGEFTFRAFAAGKMDLSRRGKPWSELIRARTTEARSDALDRLAGGLRRETLSLRDTVLAALAEVEVGWTMERTAGGRIRGYPGFRGCGPGGGGALAASHTTGRLLSEGARAALAGRTNAGKSRLF